jgi:hypothetical protein
MTLNARLDPKTKQAIKRNLEGTIYDNTRRREQTKLQAISTKNMVLCQFPHNSFSYKGEYYNFEPEPLRYKNQRLMAELQPLMDAWLADKKHVEFTEAPFINGLFNKVLNTSNSIEDYLLLLPECMHRSIRILELPAEAMLPRELSDDRVTEFKNAHADWILMLKKRMILDLVTT